MSLPLIELLQYYMIITSGSRFAIFRKILIMIHGAILQDCIKQNPIVIYEGETENISKCSKDIYSWSCLFWNKTVILIQFIRKIRKCPLYVTLVMKSIYASSSAKMYIRHRLIHHKLNVQSAQTFFLHSRFYLSINLTAYFMCSGCRFLGTG